MTRKADDTFTVKEYAKEEPDTVTSDKSDEVLEQKVDCGGSGGEEESRYSSGKSLQPNPFYESPSSDEEEGEDGGIIIHRPAPSGRADPPPTTHLPLASSEEEEEDDDGIIVLPTPVRRAPLVVEVDEASSETILVSEGEGSVTLTSITLDGSRPRRKEVVEVSRERGRAAKKNSSKKIKKAFWREKPSRNHFKEDFGSDFSDNFVSGESEGEGVEEVDDSGISLGNLLGGAGAKRRVAEVFREELEAAARSEVQRPESWTQEMDKFYNEVLHLS